MFQILCALYGVMYVVELKSKWENWLDRKQIAHLTLNNNYLLTRC